MYTLLCSLGCSTRKYIPLLFAWLLPNIEIVLLLSSFYTLVVNIITYCYHPSYRITKLPFYGHISKSIISVFVCFFIGTTCFHFISIMFGVPFIDKIHLTFLFSLLLSALSIVPIACLIGGDPSAWLSLYKKNIVSSYPLFEACSSAGAVIICSWLGALSIPLDWDRPWQVWPISCTYGALVGNFLSILAPVLFVYVAYVEPKEKV
eukprot:TRINITY_DN9109_c0_g1_i1.p1 TRINITY_DN9109_c0_g1~~TRINITY_DN9109_c0_g1_i1.p1  ORF type:complete len:206 (-),score=-4.37 TRINITY_DN9109_c0_g1_i1:13-630(-)